MENYPHVVHKPPEDEKSSSLSFTTQPRRYIPAIIGVFGVFLMMGGFAWEYINSSKNISPPEVINNSANAADKGNDSTVSQTSVKGVKNVRLVKVDVEGSVQKSGVVETPYDSRIQDVLIAAGGLTANADRNYVSKNINLAQRVSDGMKIYIPANGEQIPNVSSSVTVSQTASGLVSVNSATVNELDKLPGVGPVTANKIITGRPYQDVSELVIKKIVSTSVFEKIKGLIAI